MKSASARAEKRESVVHVEDRDGVVHDLETLEGWRLMEILRDHGVGMDNNCGGAVACAECHVLVDPTWLDKLPPPSAEELDKLDELPLIYENSRLSCQILWTHAYDGMKVTVAKAT
jgi:ferredoxin